MVKALTQVLVNVSALIPLLSNYFEKRCREINYLLVFKSQDEERKIQNEVVASIRRDDPSAYTDAIQRKLHFQQGITSHLAGQLRNQSKVE